MALLDMHPSQKAVYLILVFCLMFIENRAIDKDRSDAAKAEQSARDAENAKFQSIASGIQAAINDSDRNFALTMNETNQVLQNITGGNSFGFVVPQPFGETVPLVVWNHGNQPLSGVTVTIARTQDPDWGSAFLRPFFIGTIGPQNYAPVPNIAILPKPDETSGEDHYWIFISAQNGTVSEGLWFRKNKKGTVPWAYSYLISRDVHLRGKALPAYARKGVPPDALVTWSMPLLRRNWSDEVDQPH